MQEEQINNEILKGDAGLSLSVESGCCHRDVVVIETGPRVQPLLCVWECIYTYIYWRVHGTWDIDETHIRSAVVFLNGLIILDSGLSVWCFWHCPDFEHIGVRTQLISVCNSTVQTSSDGHLLVVTYIVCKSFRICSWIFFFLETVNIRLPFSWKKNSSGKWSELIQHFSSLVNTQRSWQHISPRWTSVTSAAASSSMSPSRTFHNDLWTSCCHLLMAE